MSSPFVYASIVLLLYAALVVGIPEFPGLLATPLAGWFNLGTLIFLVLHIVAPALAFIYLRQRQTDP